MTEVDEQRQPPLPRTAEEKRQLLARLLEQRAVLAEPAVTAAGVSPIGLSLGSIIRERQRVEDGVTPAAAETRQLEADAVLEAEIVPEGPARRLDDPRHIFLTGATGFLGAFLLHDLLATTKANVHCMVRARSAVEGRDRIVSSLRFYGLANSCALDRIVPIPGDLCAPDLGLSVQAQRHLADCIDVIHHCGAWVHFIHSYSAVRSSNVEGTRALLRLACRDHAKPLHFVSSLAAIPLVNYSHERVLPEVRLLDSNEGVLGGYGQSKWVAEKLIQTAGRRGLPVAIYRPSLVSGHSRTGALSPRAFLSHLMQGCIELGLVPECDARIPLTPVDYVSQAITYLSRQPISENGRAYHLVNPTSVGWNELIDWTIEFGHTIQRIPYQTWQSMLCGNAPYLDENPLRFLVPLFTPIESAETVTFPELFFDCRHTHAGLQGSGLSCPAVDAPMFAAFLSFLSKTGLSDQGSDQRV